MINIKNFAKIFSKPKTEQGEAIPTFSQTYLNGAVKDKDCQNFKNEFQCTEAEFEFYKIFDYVRFKSEQNARDNAPKMMIMEGMNKKRRKSEAVTNLFKAYGFD